MDDIKSKDTHEVISPEEMTALAKKFITEDAITDAASNPIFRDFLRVFLFTQMTVVECAGKTSEPMEFGYMIGLYNDKKQPIQVEIVTQIKAELHQQH